MLILLLVHCWFCCLSFYFPAVVTSYPNLTHTPNQFSDPGNTQTNIGRFYYACRGWHFSDSI